MIKLNYGKYSIPKKLDQIIELQDQLEKVGLLDFGAVLGNYFSYDELDSRYLNTPLDVISFARPGSDGIHFGFLTNFGQVSDLEEAYIVCVSPMDFDDPVKIVARNLTDFMRILCFWPDALEVVDITTPEKELKNWLKECPPLSTNQKKVSDVLCEAFQLKPIEFLFDYLQKVKQERNNEITLPTEEGIGMVSSNKNLSKAQDMFQFDPELTLDVEEIERFFRNSSYEAKLVFLRDAISKGLIFDNKKVKLYLKEQLCLLDLIDEAERVSYP
jgi:hypothetical protein